MRTSDVLQRLVTSKLNEPFIFMRLLHLHVCASDYTVPRLLLNKIVLTYHLEICFKLFIDPKVSMSLILHLFILLFHFMSGSQAWRLGTARGSVTMEEPIRSNLRYHGYWS